MILTWKFCAINMFLPLNKEPSCHGNFWHHLYRVGSRNKKPGLIYKPFNSLQLFSLSNRMAVFLIFIFQPMRFYYKYNHFLSVIYDQS